MADVTYSVGYLVDRTFDLLLGADRQEVNRLTSSLDASTTTFNIDFTPAALANGTYLAIDDETMFVWASQAGSGSSSTVTVQRGVRGTTAAAHNAQSLIFVNPYFTRRQVRNALQDIIRSWAPQVFQAKTVDVPITNWVRGYDLGALPGWMFSLDLRVSFDALTDAINEKEWPEVDSYRVDHNANTTDFPSGNALIVTTSFPPFDQPRTLHYTYAAVIDVDSPQGSNTVPFQDGDSLSVMGIDNSDLDIPVYGAAAQFAYGREIRRMLTEAQGAVADLQQFPPGYAISAADKFQAMHDKRFNDAVQRLRAQYPIRRTA